MGRAPLLLSIVAASALAVLWPEEAHAYPSSIISTPTAEALDFGTAFTSFSLNFRHNPEPVDFASFWGGLNVGITPTYKLTDSPLGVVAIGGVEVGFDFFSPADNGKLATVFNFKAQVLQETEYLPAFALGMFQISPDPKQGAMLGYFMLSKLLKIRETSFGLFAFGMMKSFADTTYLVPQCFHSGAGYCLFRGSSPFEDKNAAFMAGYRSPRWGPMGVAVDYIGGTSAVSATSIMLSARVITDVLYIGAGVYFANDRRDSPPGPGVFDGFFLSVTFGYNLPALFAPEDKTKKKPPPAPTPVVDPVNEVDQGKPTWGTKVPWIRAPR